MQSLTTKQNRKKEKKVTGTESDEFRRVDVLTCGGAEKGEVERKAPITKMNRTHRKGREIFQDLHETPPRPIFK